jgi:predicted GNAT superfamily acetyltransferase
MNHSIREATAADLEDALALNQSEVPHVGSTTMAEMHSFLSMASYFRVARNDHGDLLALLIGLGPNAGYTSLNYRWFDERYQNFAYIDRIAVAADARRQGIAKALYGDFERHSGKQSKRLCCEVNMVPENPVSMAFHQRLGFKQVGTLETGNGAKKVALLIKEIG